ncbi:hypothetical protein GCM10023089_09730 [Quisquiliibacterium transsilvanicum]|nr:thermonuclease family protein [Quisquiliibacterium transsilvanicum]
MRRPARNRAVNGIASAIDTLPAVATRPVLPILLAGAIALAGALAPLAAALADSPVRLGAPARIEAPIPIEAFATEAPGVDLSRVARVEAVLEGESIAVQDGDSFILRTGDGQKLRIRIEGIDAPEKGQPFADVSRRHLAGLLRERSLRLEVRKIDRYGRRVARVLDGDTDIALAQLQAGLAWFFRRYQSEQEPAVRRAYSRAEARAREAALGLWREEEPLPPWEQRRRQRQR